MDGISTTLPPDSEAPNWQNAVDAFLQAGFKAGDLIEHRWFHDQLGLKEPGDDDPARLLREFQFTYLGAMDLVKRALLKGHQIALSNVRGEGYRVIPTKVQVEWAERSMYGELTRSMRKGGERIVHTARAPLSSGERRKQSDALARLGQLRAFVDNHYGKRFRSWSFLEDINQSSGDE